MSTFFAEDNNETTKELYQKRLIYVGFVDRDNPDHVINFHTGEKLMYGRIDEFHVPMIINTPSVYGGIKSFDAKFCQQQNFYGAAFVVDAFHSMMQQYSKDSYNGKVSPGDEFLTELRIHKAFVNPVNLYNEQIRSYTAALKQLFAQPQTKILTFEDFITQFMATLGRTAHRSAFTQAAFTKSRHCPINCSGFAIEIADLDAANDLEKMQKFVESPNWEYFVNICNQYGFMIDQFVPWRIVADIDSEGMRPYALAYGLGNRTKIINMMYKSVHEDNFANLPNLLLGMYNAVKRPSVKLDECNGRTLPTIQQPQDYTPESLSAQYSNMYFLRLYCKIRFLEEETQFKEFEQKIIIDDCQDLARIHGNNRALDYFERIMNKPFDNVGSMSYIKKQVLAQMAEAAPRGTTVSSTDDISGY